MTNEILPVVSGLVLGVLFGLLPSLRARVGMFVALTVAFGVLATVASGEFRVSWAFLLIDIPLVAVAAAVGLVLQRRFLARRVARLR